MIVMMEGRERRKLFDGNRASVSVCVSVCDPAPSCGAEGDETLQR